jgi:YidC/Oxa1 family membrane protein insertase
MSDPANNPNQPSQKKEISMEIRLILAFALMGLVLFVTPYFYKPAPAPKQAPPAKAPIQTSGTPAAPAAAATLTAQKPKAAAAAKPVPAVAAAKEESYTVETDLYRIVFSNRGAVVRSWILKKYVDNAGKQLELANPASFAKVGLPFALNFRGPKPSTDPNQVLFVAKPLEGAPGIEFNFSNGTLQCRKVFRFRKDHYLAEVSSEVVDGGVAVPHLLVWRGGFGDEAVPNVTSAQRSVHYDLAQDKLIVNEAKAAKDGPLVQVGSFSFAGIEDAYFASVVLPAPGTVLEINTLADSLPSPADANKEELRVGMGVGGQGSHRLSMFVGPKNIDILRRVDPKLEQMVDFGWFGFLAKPLFFALNWTNDKIAHNYGWAIILVTVAINFLLLPLKITSLKSMTKMSVIQPQIKAINDKYKGLSLRDPKKSQQNQEVMDLYKKHGVNPMGGCVPMVLQIPFFIAFYKVLSVAIEMRGAPWLWVNDLSQPEHLAIRFLPVAMIATQFILQKMTPSTSADPSQQKVMMFMPLMLGFMFYGVSSGLVLYWLTGNLVGIAQQWFFNRLMPVAKLPQPAPKKKGSRN